MPEVITPDLIQLHAALIYGHDLNLPQQPVDHRYRMAFRHVDAYEDANEKRVFPLSHHVCDTSEPIWPPPPSLEVLRNGSWIELNPEPTLGYYTPDCCFELPYKQGAKRVSLLIDNDGDNDNDEDMQTCHVECSRSNSTAVPEERAFVYNSEITGYLLHHTRELVERARFGGTKRIGNGRTYSLFLSSAKIVWADPAPSALTYHHSKGQEDQKHSCAVTPEHLGLVRARGHIDHIHVEFRLTKRYTNDVWGMLQKGMDSLVIW
jgi:hypothetical protein